MTAVDTHTFNTSQKDRLFSPSVSVTHGTFCRALLPSIFQAWQSWRESGIDGQPAAQDPTLPAPFLLELGGGKIIDSKLFLFFPAFLPSTLHADILWWNKSVPIEIPAETACYLLTRYLNCGLRGKLYGGLSETWRCLCSALSVCLLWRWSYAPMHYERPWQMEESERGRFLALFWLVVSSGIVIKSKQSNTYVIQSHHCS